MWHVEDLKISRMELDVVTDIIESLSKKYGDIIPLFISRWKIYDYPGMVFD